jgi:pimeloyl-ACP methyl ester carboxylesterase
VRLGARRPGSTCSASARGRAWRYAGPADRGAACGFPDWGAGLHLAYQVIGEGPLDIVLVPGFVSHVERVWEVPRARAALMGLAQLGRLILFDRRGVGLSDRVGAAPTVEATAVAL